MRTRREIIAEYYVNAKDLQRLLRISYKNALRLFREIEEQEEKKRFRAHERKVPLVDCLKLAGVEYYFLKEQIEGENRC